MIKQLVQWKGLNNRDVSKTFYFNLTEYEVAGEMKLEELHARFKKFQEEVIDQAPRDLTPPEVREMLDMVKVIVRYAYGEYRETPEGGEIWKDAQDPDVWNRFVASGGFNAFIWYLFKDGKRANQFMENIWPESYRNGNIPTPAETTSEAPDDGIPTLESVPDISPVPDISATANEKPWGDYTQEELLALSDEEFQKIVENATDGRNVPFQLLVIGGQRMNQEKDLPNQ